MFFKNISIALIIIALLTVLGCRSSREITNLDLHGEWLRVVAVKETSWVLKLTFKKDGVFLLEVVGITEKSANIKGKYIIHDGLLMLRDPHSPTLGKYECEVMDNKLLLNPADADFPPREKMLTGEWIPE